VASDRQSVESEAQKRGWRNTRQDSFVTILDKPGQPAITIRWWPDGKLQHADVMGEKMRGSRSAVVRNLISHLKS
jgi:predicted transcriptional regulator